VLNEATTSGANVHRIAVLAPMRSELKPLLKPLGLSRSREREPGFLWGKVGGIEVVAALTGIGMRAGAQSAARIIEATSPDHLIVVGVAGGIGGSVAVGDLIVPDLVLNLDTGATLRPIPLGDRTPQGTLASSVALLESSEQARRLHDRGVVAIDMETAAIAEACELRGCAWSVFRAVSDRADDGSTDAAVLGLVGSDGTPNLAAVARFVLTRPHRIPQLLRLARGANVATRAAAGAAFAALDAHRPADWPPVRH
jgi:adenosylhomocysteine nucleosidase